MNKLSLQLVNSEALSNSTTFFSCILKIGL